jgi:tryptophan 2,3-dioxygenase
MDAFRQGALGAGMPAFVVDLLADLQRYYVEGKAAHVSPDVERVIGRKPGTFDQFARDYAEALKATA